ncbi:MAG: hypothetical protein ACRCXD_01125, partial [Luteolibacter sp.]
MIPVDLPPTTGPCPHCGEVITSPEPGAPKPVAAFQVPPLAIIAPLPQVMPPVPVVIESKLPPPPPTQQIEETPHPLAKEETPKIEPPHREPISESEVPKVKPTPKKSKRRSGLIPAMVVLLILGLAGGGIFYFVSKGLEAPVAPPVMKTQEQATAVSEA